MTVHTPQPPESLADQRRRIQPCARDHRERHNMGNTMATCSSARDKAGDLSKANGGMLSWMSTDGQITDRVNSFILKKKVCAGWQLSPRPGVATDRVPGVPVCAVLSLQCGQAVCAQCERRHRLQGAQQDCHRTQPRHDG
eukprot:7387664-Prymnesium_polylepis.1